VLLLATERAGQTGTQMSPEELDAELRSATDGNGRRILPAFSRQTTLVAWLGERAAYAGLAGRDVLQFFLGGEWEVLVVDPATPYERDYTRPDAERMLASAGS
jgi:hypothetical protein